MPISSFGLDGLVGLIKAKASTNVVLSFLFGYALGTTFIGAMLCIQLLMVLGGACSREQTSIIGRAAQSVVVLLTLGAGSVLAVRVGVMGYHGGCRIIVPHLRLNDDGFVAHLCRASSSTGGTRLLAKMGVDARRSSFFQHHQFSG